MLTSVCESPIFPAGTTPQVMGRSNVRSKFLSAEEFCVFYNQVGRGIAGQSGAGVRRGVSE
jgi:hypothetical protein